MRAILTSEPDRISIAADATIVVVTTHAKDRKTDQRLRVMHDEGRRALVVDGVIISVADDHREPPSGYWAAMLPHGSPRSALLLGLGGGTLAHSLNRRYPGIQMVGVDADDEVIRFAREHFNLDLANLEIVVGDAFEYVDRCRREFDFVAVDLFVGYDFQRGALSKPFLRRIRTLAGHGEIVFNLFKDRRTAQHLERIGRVLRVQQLDEVGKNLVVHCR